MGHKSLTRVWKRPLKIYKCCTGLNFVRCIWNWRLAAPWATSQAVRCDTCVGREPWDTTTHVNYQYVTHCINVYIRLQRVSWAIIFLATVFCIRFFKPSLLSSLHLLIVFFLITRAYFSKFSGACHANTFFCCFFLHVYTVSSSLSLFLLCNFRPFIYSFLVFFPLARYSLFI